MAPRLPCKAYTTDVNDEVWTRVVSYLIVSPDDALSRRYPLRYIFPSFPRAALDDAQQLGLALAADHLSTLGASVPADAAQAAVKR